MAVSKQWRANMGVGLKKKPVNPVESEIRKKRKEGNFHRKIMWKIANPAAVTIKRNNVCLLADSESNYFINLCSMDKKIK